MVVLLAGVSVDDEDSGRLGLLSIARWSSAWRSYADALRARPVHCSRSPARSSMTATPPFSSWLILIAAAMTVLMSVDYVADAGTGRAPSTTRCCCSPRSA